ncbi:MAG: cyclic pyranopterin monophosphate synthase MoaC [Candidatus Omnitrophota bacterium]
MGMVDVSIKKKTLRVARAGAVVSLNKEIIEKIRTKTMPKGDVLEDARISGILACKKTHELIPLCHTLEVEYADVCFVLSSEYVRVESVVKTTGKTGVEMEALVACSVAALTIYDMCKMFSRDIEIEKIYLLEKRGGKSGHYIRK